MSEGVQLKVELGRARLSEKDQSRILVRTRQDKVKSYISLMMTMEVQRADWSRSKRRRDLVFVSLATFLPI